MTGLPVDTRPDRATDGARLFVLRRFFDVSGVSGEGDVAEGVEWSDGTVSLRWPGEHPSVTFWQDGVSSVEAVHGHGGATAVVFLVDEPAHPSVPAVGADVPRRVGRR